MVRPIHDWMPVILSPADSRLWLDPELTSPESLQALLRPCDPAPMIAYPVARRANVPVQNDAALTDPLVTLGRLG